MTKEKYIFPDVPDTFNLPNLMIGKDMHDDTRLRAIMRRCNILNQKYGKYLYCIVAKEHKTHMLIYGVNYINNKGIPDLTKPFWIPRTSIQIERVID